MPSETIYVIWCRRPGGGWGLYHRPKPGGFRPEVAAATTPEAAARVRAALKGRHPEFEFAIEPTVLHITR